MATCKEAFIKQLKDNGVPYQQMDKAIVFQMNLEQHGLDEQTTIMVNFWDDLYYVLIYDVGKIYDDVGLVLEILNKINSAEMYAKYILEKETICVQSLCSPMYEKNDTDCIYQTIANLLGSLEKTLMIFRELM